MGKIGRTTIREREKELPIDVRLGLKFGHGSMAGPAPKVTDVRAGRTFTPPSEGRRLFSDRSFVTTRLSSGINPFASRPHAETATGHEEGASSSIWRPLAGIGIAAAGVAGLAVSLFADLKLGTSGLLRDLLQFSPLLSLAFSGVFFAQTPATGGGTATGGAGGGGPSRLPMTPARAKAAFSLATPNPKEREVLIEALLHLKSHFKPDDIAAGRSPTKAAVTSSVNNRYRNTYAIGLNENLSTLRKEVITRLSELLLNFLSTDTNAADLGLVGTKPVQARPPRALPGSSNRGPKVCIPEIIEAAEEAIRFAEAAAQKMPEHQMALLEGQGSSPEGLIDAAQIELNDLKQAKDARGASAALQKIERLAGDARLIYLRTCVAFEREVVTEFEELSRIEVDKWLSLLPDDAGVKKEDLRRFFRNYIGVWLDTNQGESPKRITLSLDAVKDAVLLTIGSERSDDAKKFEVAAKNLVSYVVYTESWKDRTILPEGAEASLPSGHRLPISGRIKNEGELASVIGSELFLAYNEFFSAILDGRAIGTEALSKRERRDLALRWKEMFIYYARHGVSTWGDRFDASHMKEHGLEPRLVKAIYRSVTDGGIYNDAVIELLRLFFEVKVVPNTPVPEAKYLRPVAVRDSAGAQVKKDDRFVPYMGGSLKELLQNMPFAQKDDQGKVTFSAEFKDRFLEAAGLTWSSFIEYGSERPMPPQMTEEMQDTLINDILRPEELESFLISHPPSEPSAGVDWEARVRAASKAGKLRELATDQIDVYRTSVITDRDWDRYKEYCRTIDRLELITVGPASEKAYLGVLKAYIFIVGELKGRYLDAVEYLAAISPVIRRMWRDARDGVIPIEIPSFMGEVPFRNIGQPTFAQQIQRMGGLSGAKAQLLDSHAKRETHNPLFTTDRKIARELALKAGGGRDMEERLYELQAGVFRFAHVIESFVNVISPLGKKASYAPDNVPVKFILQMVPNTAEFLRTQKGLLKSVREDVIIKARRNYYGQLIENARDYLTAIAGWGLAVESTLPDGRKVDTLDLLKRLDELETQHLHHSTALRSSLSSMSLKDIEEIYDFYRGLSDFAEEIFFFTRFRGEANVGGETILFDIAPRMKGYKYSKTNDRVVLFLDDVERTATIENWDNERKDALILARLLVSHLLRTGIIDPSVISAAISGDPTNTGPSRENGNLEYVPEAPAFAGMTLLNSLPQALSARWTMDPALLDRAVRDYMDLEARAVAMRLKDTLGNVTGLPGVKGAEHRGPVLRRWAAEWSQQFRLFAAESGLPKDVMASAENTLGEYFDTVRNFYGMFWENTLRFILKDRLQDKDQRTIDAVYKTIVEFMPTVGVANGAETRMKDIEPGKVTGSDIARQALLDYAFFFKQDKSLAAQLPYDEALLKDLINLLCIEHNFTEPTMAFEQARDQLLEFNKGKPPAEFSISEPPAGAQIGAMGLERLKWLAKRWAIKNPGRSLDAGALEKAYFRFLPRLYGGSDVSDTAVNQALLEINGASEGLEAETDVLTEFFKDRLDTARLWEEIINDPKSGFVAFVRSRYRAPYFTDNGLAAFATVTGLESILSATAVDIDSIARSYVEDPYLPYESIAQKMAVFYKALFFKYLEQVRSEAARPLADAREAAELVLADSPLNIIYRPETFFRYVADITRPASETLRAQRIILLTDEILGLKEESTIQLGILETMNDLYERSVEPKLLALFLRRRMLAGEMDKLLAGINALMERVLAASVDEYLPKDVETLNRRFAGEAETRVKQGLQVVGELEGEAKKAERSPNRAHDIAKELNGCEIPELNDKEANIRAAGAFKDMKAIQALIRDLRDKLNGALKALAARMEEIEKRKQFEALKAEAKVKAGKLLQLVSDMELTGKPFEQFGNSMPIFYYTKFKKALMSEGKITPASFKAAHMLFEELSGLAPDFIEVITNIERLFSEIIAEADNALEESRKIIASLGDADSKETGLLGAIEKLVSELTTKRQELAGIAAAKKALPGMLTSMDKALDDAIQRIPVPTELAYKASEANAETGLAFNTQTPNVDYRSKAQRVLAQFLEDIVAATVDERIHLIYAAGAVKPVHGKLLEATSLSGKKIPVIRATRYFKLGDLPGNHPLRIAADALKSAVSENGYEAQLIGELSGKKERDFLADLVIFLAEKAQPANTIEARKLVREWALSQASALIKALGPEKLEEIFIRELDDEVIPEEDRTVESKWEDEHGAEYTIEEHEATAEMIGEMLLAPEKAKGFPHLSGSLPERIEELRLLYRIFSTPSLRPLGWLIKESVKGRPDHDWNYYLFRLELFNNLIGGRQRFSLRKMQATTLIGREIYDRNRHPIFFVEPDKEMLERFPETRYLPGYTAKSLYSELATEPGTSMAHGMPRLLDMWQRFPDLGPLFVTIAVANGTDRLYGDFHKRFNSLAGEIWEDTTRLAHVEAEYRREWIDLYAEFRDLIVSALSADRGDIFYSELYYGRKRPWEEPSNDVNALPPHERLRLLVPEAFPLKPRVVADWMDKVPEMAKGGNKDMYDGARRFMELYPELASVVAMDMHLWLIDPQMAGHSPIEPFYKGLYHAEAPTLNRDMWLERFASLHASPWYVERVRSNLARRLIKDDEGKWTLTSNDNRGPLEDRDALRLSGLYLYSITGKDRPEGISVAEILTGTDKPWLPSLREMRLEEKARLLPGTEADLMTAYEKALPELPRLNNAIAHGMRDFLNVTSKSGGSKQGAQIIEAIKEFAHQFPSLANAAFLDMLVPLSLSRSTIEDSIEQFYLSFAAMNRTGSVDRVKCLKAFVAVHTQPEVLAATKDLMKGTLSVTKVTAKHIDTRVIIPNFRFPSDKAMDGAGQMLLAIWGIDRSHALPKGQLPISRILLVGEEDAPEGASKGASPGIEDSAALDTIRKSLPEIAMLRDEVVAHLDVSLELLDGKDDGTLMPGARTTILGRKMFVERFPEFKKAVALDYLLITDYNNISGVNFFFRLGNTDPKDVHWPTLLSKFVGIVTGKEFVRVVNGILQGTYAPAPAGNHPRVSGVPKGRTSSDSLGLSHGLKTIIALGKRPDEHRKIRDILLLPANEPLD